MAAEQWQIKLGPCVLLPHPVRNGILLVTKTEVISGESECHPPKTVTKAMIENVIARHGTDFVALIANFQKFILGMVTIQQGDNGEGSGYSLYVERCYEMNRLQRLSLLKYLANEIVSRACMLAVDPAKYPSDEEFEKMKNKS